MTCIVILCAIIRLEWLVYGQVKQPCNLYLQWRTCIVILCAIIRLEWLVYGQVKQPYNLYLQWRTCIVILCAIIRLEWLVYGQVKQPYNLYLQWRTCIVILCAIIRLEWLVYGQVKQPCNLCHSAWEDQRRRCANICHMALPARASQCQYENSGTPASLISHALNEILALGIPMYTYGQLVATAFFCIVGKEIQSKYREKNKTLN